MSRRTHRLTLDNLRLLDAIDRLGSFAAAARELCVVTSSITHAIHGIEDQLGIHVFDRSGRRARFTREGRMLLERGRELLDGAARFDAEVQMIATGWEASLVIAVDQVIRTEPSFPRRTPPFASVGISFASTGMYSFRSFVVTRPSTMLKLMSTRFWLVKTFRTSISRS